MCGALPCNNCVKYFPGVPTGTAGDSTWGIDTGTTPWTLYIFHSGVWNTIAGSSVSINQATTDIIARFDGGGSPIAAGAKIYIPVDFAATIEQVTLLPDQSGSITCNIWKCTYAQFDAGVTHPVAGDSITAADTPAIAAASKYQDAVLTGWNTAINAGDILAFEIPATATNITTLTAALKVLKS